MTSSDIGTFIMVVSPFENVTEGVGVCSGCIVMCFC